MRERERKRERHRDDDIDAFASSKEDDEDTLLLLRDIYTHIKVNIVHRQKFSTQGIIAPNKKPKSVFVHRPVCIPACVQNICIYIYISVDGIKSATKLVQVPG